MFTGAEEGPVVSTTTMANEHVLELGEPVEALAVYDTMVVPGFNTLPTGTDGGPRETMPQLSVATGGAHVAVALQAPGAV